jgi:hypothetical protein
VFVVNLKQLNSSPLVHWIGEFDRIGAAFGLEFSKSTDRVWLACGESYPRHTLFVLEGRFVPTKLETRMQELAKERRFASRVFRENEGKLLVISFEAPIASSPIPGFPTTLFAAVLGPETIIVAFDRETIVEAASQKSWVSGTRTTLAFHVAIWPKSEASTLSLVAGSTPAFLIQTMGVKGIVREASCPASQTLPQDTGSWNSLVNTQTA